MEGTCTDSYTRERMIFLSLQMSVYFTYTVSIRFIYYCSFKVVYSNFQSLFIRTYKLDKNLLQPRFTIQDPFQTIRHVLYNYFLEII